MELPKQNPTFVSETDSAKIQITILDPKLAKCAERDFELVSEFLRAHLSELIGDIFLSNSVGFDGKSVSQLNAKVMEFKIKLIQGK